MAAMKVLNEQSIPKFNPQIYTRVALNDLVAYAVYFLTQTKGEITAEDIVAACFLLFPNRFALTGYPQWPDSTVVNKRWIDCRDKGFITGSTARGFSLTPKGLELAEKVGKTLTGERPLFRAKQPNNVRADMRTRAGRFVRALEESDAYEAYKRDGESAAISEFDFRSMLLCTMESSPSTLQNNIEQFKQHAALSNRDDLLKFLDVCTRRFMHLLAATGGGSEKYRGGMLRKKIR
jgi:hypothetical protein